MKFLDNLEKLSQMYDDMQGDDQKAASSQKKQKAKVPMAAKKPKVHDPGYQENAKTAVPADVRMFSGCKDDQTSADVHDTSSFGLPSGDTGEAGGACTNALLKSVSAPGAHKSWVDLLKSMQSVLKTKKFTQVPQLSTSRDINMQEPYDIMKAGSKRHKALLIGINYVGQQGELRGCHNDVEDMQQYIQTEGYTNTAQTMKVLMDDGQHEEPTAANIREAFEWLVGDAEAGDSLFMHYSGHGGNQKDDKGDEEDGMDETLIPVDYQQRGMITDDELFKLLIAPLPEGVEFTIVMDCCHSGSIMDLPFRFQGTGAVLEAVANGEVEPAMEANPNFNLRKVLQVGYELFQMYNTKNATPMQMGEHAMKQFGVSKESLMSKAKGLF